MLGLGAGVDLAFGAGELALELLVAGEPIAAQAPVVDGGPDRATGLALVAAVAESTCGGELGDVVEGDLDPVVRAGDLQRADARRVDQEGAARQIEQLPVGRRVAPARVVLTNRPPVTWRCSPRSALTSVDLPTPDPSTTAV